MILGLSFMKSLSFNNCSYRSLFACKEIDPVVSAVLTLDCQYSSKTSSFSRLAAEVDGFGCN